MSALFPLPFQQVGVSQIEFQVLPGLEVGSSAKKNIRPGSFLGPDKLCPQSGSFARKGEKTKLLWLPSRLTIIFSFNAQKQSFFSEIHVTPSGYDSPPPKDGNFLRQGEE